MPKKRPGNSHSNRHENGVVAPGKKIVKQKSNGHLKGGSDSNSPVSRGPSPSTAEPAPALSERHIGNGQVVEDARASGCAVQTTNATHSELQDGKDSFSTIANGHVYPARKSTATSRPMRKNGALSLGVTILRSCPIGDTITILIILLSIPSTMLTLINTLFAMLTFMPPSGSSFSFPNSITDVFQGSGGTPSLATIVITDVLGLLIWLAAWTPLQALAIEYAQAVVAATLGGGNASKKSSYDSTLLCMMIVTIRHVSTSGWMPPPALGFGWPAVLSRIPHLKFQPPAIFPPVDDEHVFASGRMGWGWLHVLVALHILIQGLVQIARRWYQRREYVQPGPITKKADPEVGGGASSRSTSNSYAEPNTPTSLSNNVSTAPKGVSPGTKDLREKVSSGKKRKKQATLVRSQQPLWAAFAATKVTVMREYEQAHALADTAIENAKDTSDLGSASFEDSADQFWFTHIDSDGFAFETTFRTDVEGDGTTTNAREPKPLYIRMNDTEWSSTDLALRRKEGKEHAVWKGVVYGLAPLSSYRCALVTCKDDVVIYSTTVTTSSSLAKNADADIQVIPTEPAISPASPTTTLKKSIAAFEDSLGELHARQKKSKKDNKAAAAAIKKDIDVFQAKIGKLSSEDRSHNNRNLQWSQHMKHAEEAISSMDEQLEDLGNIPQDLVSRSKVIKESWEETKGKQNAARDMLFQAKDARHRKIVSAQSEANSMQQKKERLEGRLTKLNEQWQKLRTTDGLQSHERTHSEQTAKEAQWRQRESELQDQIAKASTAWHESRYLIGQYIAQSNALETAFQERQMMPPPSRNSPAERPLTPEGDLPGEKPQHPAAATIPPRFPAFGTPESSRGLRSHSGSLRNRDGDVVDGRPRSSSLLSGQVDLVGNAHQVELLDDPRVVRAIRRADSRSSADGSGSSSGASQRDPASPAQAQAQAQGHPGAGTGIVGKENQSPIGKRSPVWNQ